MKPIKGILLDLDGTLVDSRYAYIEAMKLACRRIGAEEIDSRNALEIPKRLEQNLPINDIVRGIDAREFLREYLLAYYRTSALKTKPMPCISITLKKLSEKAKLALITMRHVPKKKLIEELDKFGLAEYFEQVMTSLDAQNPKPSPEALVNCARRLGLEIDECIVVGDSVVDVKAGKRAGMRTFAVLSGIFSREELEKEKPDLILKNVNELVDFIK